MVSKEVPLCRKPLINSARGRGTAKDSFRITLKARTGTKLLVMDGEPIAAAVARCRKGDKPNVAPRSTKAAVNPNKAAFASRDIKTPFELEIKKAKPDRRDAAQ